MKNRIKKIDIWEQENAGELSTIDGELRLALADRDQCGFDEYEIICNTNICITLEFDREIGSYSHAVIIKKEGKPERIVLFYHDLENFEAEVKQIFSELGISNYSVTDAQVPQISQEKMLNNTPILSACDSSLAAAFARAAADASCESEFLDQIVGWSLHPYGEMHVGGDLGDSILDIEHKGVCELCCKNTTYLIALQKEANIDWKDIIKEMLKLTFPNDDIEKIAKQQFSGLSEYDDYTWTKPSNHRVM